MPIRLRSLVIVLAAAGFVVCARAADVPPVVVHQRVLVMPELPAGADVSTNPVEAGAIRMPFVTGGAPGVARRIDEAVWREMLDGASAPATPGKTFTLLPDKLPAGGTSIDYTVDLMPAAQPRLLSLGFSGQACGAYCEDFAQTHVFDLRDGRELSLGDLLTVDGFAALGRRADAERRRAYQKQVRELRAALKSTPKGKKKDPDGDDGDRLMLDEDCRKQVDNQPSTPQWLTGEVFALDGHGGVVLSIERCSNHAMRSLDDVGEIKVTIAAADLKDWLTPYGLAVVRQEGDAPSPPPTMAGRELHGRLGGMPITMKLEPLRDDVETRGWYAYDKYRTPIALAVHEDGDRLSATEQTGSQGRFELTTAGGSLVGTWRDKDGRKSVPVILQ